MSVQRLIAIVVIFAAASVAWLVLGASLWSRTETLDDSLSREMDSLWGPKVLAQVWPAWQGKSPYASAVAPSASEVTADIQHENRYKGLLWYSTFTVRFEGKYTIPASAGGQAGTASDAARAEKSEGTFLFPLPKGVTRYNDLSVTLDGQPVPVNQADVIAGQIAFTVSRLAERKICVIYVTGGRDMWVYSPAEPAPSPQRGVEGGTELATSAKMGQLSNFSLTVRTNFDEIDYPRGTASPTAPANRQDGKAAAEWKYPNALTSQAMGVVMPMPINAGPVAARMSYFAPVSLFFFFTAMLAVVVLHKVPLHPMHYLFIAAGFFAFHILMAYLADIVSIHVAFWICSVVSVFLVVSYLRLVAGVKFGVLYAGAAQLVYLVAFAYAFFWVGKTGLTVTVLAIVTLFVLMQATGRVNWSEVIKRRPSPDKPNPDKPVADNPIVLPPAPPPLPIM